MIATAAANIGAGVYNMAGASQGGGGGTDDFGSGGRAEPMDNRQAREAAGRLGFKEVKGSPVESHGQLVFQRRNRFISPDIDVHHSGGTSKMFDLDGNRLGTYSEDLSVKIGK
jgi:hypothetical protein